MWPITNQKKKAFLGTTFICLDIQKTFHQHLHTYSGPNATPVDQLNVVGRIYLIQGSDLYNQNTNTKIIIGLLLHRSKLVRLTIWDKEAANFRELNRISTRKNQIVFITSIIPQLYEGKLAFTTTPGSRFYFDNDIDIVQRF
ncbi:unnamed protein product [Brassica oleracea var. botrytis]|uniref:Replication protein A OB domain-containing protein n=1 Tax=Brassica oleracea TaxID=3712 RepID=A0A3P6EH43_BRAOL|nr:unnamed protein product [Brassica oleracea]